MKHVETAVVLGFFKDDKYLSGCIRSLNKQSYQNFQIYIYDNSCREGALDRVKLEFPDVIVRHNKKNLGFAGGNNSIMREVLKQDEIKYIALLNDDTLPDEGWLENLIIAYKENEKHRVGAIASKLIFYDDFVSVEFKSHEDVIKFLSVPSFTSTDYTRFFPREGFSGPFQHTENGNDVYLAKGRSVIDLPIGNTKKNPIRVCYLNIKVLSDKITSLSIEVAGIHREVDLVAGINELSLEFPLADLQMSSFQIIQNVGSGLTASLDGFDIGSGEIDRGQYNTQHNTNMFCGGAVLLATEALKDTGLFNDYLFNYYEDSDLSLRMRARGWSIVYEPKAVVRHVHSFSGVEWSDFFTFHVTRNRIIFASLNFGFIGYRIKIVQSLRDILYQFNVLLRRTFVRKDWKRTALLISAVFHAHIYLVIKFITDRKNEDRYL